MTDYIPVVLAVGIGGVVVAAMSFLNRILGPSEHTEVKDETFECGNLPSGTAWARWSIKFYLVAILFIVFDVEIVFMYPWAVILRELGMFGLIEMLIFVTILAVGYVYAWRKGAFEW